MITSLPLCRFIFSPRAGQALLLAASGLLAALPARAAHYADLTADELTVGPTPPGNLTVNGAAVFNGTLDVVGNATVSSGFLTADEVRGISALSVGSLEALLIAVSGNVVSFTASAGDGEWEWKRDTGNVTPMSLSADGILTLTGNSGTLVLDPDALRLPNVANGNVTHPAISFAGSSSNTGIFSSGTDTVQFSIDGAEQVRIDGSGNVGIGTASPGTRLHVSTPVSTNATAFMLSATTNSVDWKFDVGNKFGLSSRSLAIYSSNNTAADFAVNPSGGTTPPLVVTSGGNVGVGTISPAMKLHVHGANYNVATFSSSGNQSGVEIKAANTTSNNAEGVLAFYSGNTKVLNIGYMWGNSTGAVAQLQTGTTTHFRMQGGASGGFDSFNLMPSGNIGIAGLPTVRFQTFGEVKMTNANGTVLAVAVNSAGNVSISTPLAISADSTFSGTTTTSFGANTTLTISGTTSFSGNNTVTGNTTTTFTENTTLDLNGTVNFGENAEVRFNKVYGDISMGDFGEE